MDRRCVAGALLALASCIATAAAAPTASNQTALDVYDGTSEGCYYNFQHYGEGDRIMTNEPCLNCTCHNRMLMCYLRVCPFTKPIGQDCSVEKRADQCCPIVTCPDVPVDLLTSTSTLSPAEYGETGLGKLDRYGCSINGKYLPEGSKVPPTPNKPCEHCYCIRNMTTCVMQECTLHVDGCTPIYRKDVCCPVRYSCDHPEDEIPLLDDMTTTVRPTPGFLLTTTTLSPVTQMTQDCVHDDKIFADGALIKTEKACEHCYCMKGDIVCVVQECGTPMENEGKNCTSMPPREGQCCPDTYICEGDEITTETKPDTATVTSFQDITTLSPPRRVSVEGSGYRSETDEPFTEIPTFEPDTEGSGEDQQPFKPTDASDILTPESETTPLITTDHDEHVDQYSPSTPKVPVTDMEYVEKMTTEPDKGENTVPGGAIDEDSSEVPLHETIPERETTTSTKLATTTAASLGIETTAFPELSIKDKVTPDEDTTSTAPASIAEPTIDDHELHRDSDSSVTTEGEYSATTLPSRKQLDDEEIITETTTLKVSEEISTKAGDLTAPDTLVTESTTTSLIEQETQTETPQKSEKDDEVLVQVPTTAINLDLTTKSDIIEAETQTATTIEPEIVTEISTPGKVELTETTSANPIENEIDEESFPTSAPGRIPGEGDCLLDGVTYSHDSIVPSSNNCHASCRCISSIVKCDPIICSPPPDYMDNCQPMYDSIESCCPTYVCDHPRETVPPQSHSQMAGTDSPIPTPTIECHGDQCEIVKDKEDTKPAEKCSSDDCADNSTKTPAECGTQGCNEVETKPKEPGEECIGNSCSSSPEQCADSKCETAIPKDQLCNNENGCETSVTHTCEGDECSIHPDVSPTKDDSTLCENPDNCKQTNIPEKLPECTGASCISELPSQTIPQEKQDCKSGDDCAQPDQIPAGEECNEEGCRKQQVPDVNKPVPSDCTDTECVQQDYIPQTTDLPEINTELIPKVTELPKDTETKSEESVTDLPKITEIEKETEPSTATDTPISQKEKDPQDGKESQTSATDGPETETKIPEVTQSESVTDRATDIETTTAQLQYITKVDESVEPQVPTTEIPNLSDKEEISTEISSVGSTTSAVSETPEDEVEHKDSLDITTVEPSLAHSTSSTISQDITESQEMLTLAPESLDKDGHEEMTKEPEYVQDTEPRVTEPAETYTTAPEQLSTDNIQDKPIPEQEPQNTPTTHTPYESETSVPEIHETKAPIEEVQELTTDVPKTQTTSLQDEDKEEPKLPEYTLQPEDSITSKPDDMKQTTIGLSSSDVKGETETKAPVFDSEDTTKLEPSVDEGSVTQAPDFIGTSDEDSSTKVPVHDITREPESQTESIVLHVTSPQEMVTQESDKLPTEDKHVEIPSPVTENVQTETPMSIVKDHDDDEISVTKTPEFEASTEHDDSTTKKSELPETDLFTESSKPEETPSEKPTFDTEKMSSVSDEVNAPATTEKSVDGLETTISSVSPTEQPVQESKITAIPETETSTYDNAPVSVSIIDELSSEHPEPSVTEAGIQESSVPKEESSEIVPTTSIPVQDIETKAPSIVTESSVQPVSEGVDIIVPTEEQIAESTDATELPELTIHEHPTEPSIVKESEQSPPEQIDTAVTETPVMVVTEPLEVESEKDITDTPLPQDAVTNVAELPTSEAQKEVTEVPEQDIATKSPELAQTTQPKTDDTQIPELSVTKPEKEPAETQDIQTTPTNVSEMAATGTQKEATESPMIHDNVTSAPTKSETEPQETTTEEAESQDTVTKTPDDFVVEPHKDSTEIPQSHDIVTEQHKESTDVPEISNTESNKDISAPPETQEVSDISTTEVQKEVTEIPEPLDATTKVSDMSPAEPHKETAGEPEIQDTVTSVPTPSEQETTKQPEEQDVVTNIPEVPETVPKTDTTEIPVAQEVATSSPEVPVTESVPAEEIVVPDVATIVPSISVTEPERDATEAPYHEDTSNAPDTSATEPQEEATEIAVINQQPDSQDKFTTESPTYVTQTPESQGTATSAAELPETDTNKETTQIPILPELDSIGSEISQTEPSKDITEAPKTPVVTDAPEISVTESQKEPTLSPQTQGADYTSPERTATETQKEVTIAPELQDIATIAVEVSPTESQKDRTGTPETTEKTDIDPYKDSTESPEPHETASDLPEVLATESQKETTETSEIATKTPEILATESDKEITESPEEEYITKKPERTQTEGSGDEAKPEETTVPEKDTTEAPLKITTKSDDHTQPEQQQLETPTESSKIESDTSPPTEDGLLVEQSTEVPQSLPTKTPVSVPGTDATTDKPTEEEEPQEGHEIATESPVEEPAKTSLFIEPEKSDLTTVSPISLQPIETETMAPELSDTESGSTRAPELFGTDKQDYTKPPESEQPELTQTQTTAAPAEEKDVITNTPEPAEPQDITTKSSEEPEQTSVSKDEYPETTPYLVLLEEHTHKKDIYTESTDEEITASPDVPQKEYEPSTTEASIEKVTEYAPSTETEKSPQEVEVPGKDQSVPELTETTISEKITEHSLVSEESTTITPLIDSLDTEKPQTVESNEISTSTPTRDEVSTETAETVVPVASTVEAVTEKEVALSTEKPHEPTAPEEDLILATTKATTLNVEEEPTTPSQLDDKFVKPEEAPKPAAEPEKPKPDTTEEIPKPGANEVQPTEEALQPDDDSHFPPSGTSGYGQEPDYGEEDSFGPGTCRYGGKVYVSAQQIPRDDPCDFCFCFRSDIICLQQSCPPPIHGCHEEPIQGFCCPRYECPVSMATTLNVTTTTTTTTTTLPPHFLPHAYKGAAQRRGCQIKGHTYKVGEVVRASSGPCLHCTCGGDGQMKCDPKVCTPEPMLRQMIAAAVSAKRRR